MYNIVKYWYMMNWYKYLLTLIFNIVNPEECTYKRVYKKPNN